MHPYIRDTVFSTGPLTRDEMDQVMEDDPGAKTLKPNMQNELSA